MVVVHDLPPEFQVKLFIKMIDPLQDGGGLFLYVSFVIEAGFSRSLNNLGHNKLG